MHTFCQWLMLVHLIALLFVGLYQDFNGRKAKEPFGFTGAVLTVVVTALMFVIYYAAGGFTRILP